VCGKKWREYRYRVERRETRKMVSLKLQSGHAEGDFVDVGWGPGSRG
jgi:hypothetical protein